MSVNKKGVFLYSVWLWSASRATNWRSLSGDQGSLVAFNSSVWSCLVEAGYLHLTNQTNKRTVSREIRK